MTEKLIYFPLKGRGEYLRLILEAAGANYVYEAVTYEQWQALKPTLPFGQIPAYEDGDLKLVQTQAIARHLGRKYNFYGSTEAEHSHVDVVIEGFLDLIQALFKLIFGPDMDKNLAEFGQSTLLTHLGNLEAYLKRNNNGDGFFVGSGLTIADLKAFFVLEVYINPLYPEVLAKFPKLAGLVDRVSKLPKIQEYLASPRRPKTALPRGPAALTQPSS